MKNKNLVFTVFDSMSYNVEVFTDYEKAESLFESLIVEYSEFAKKNNSKIYKESIESIDEYYREWNLKTSDDEIIVILKDNIIKE